MSKWNSIRPQLIEYVERLNVKYFKHIQNNWLMSRIAILLEFFKKHTKSKSVNTIIPPAPMFYLFDPLRDLIMNTPADIELTISDIEEASVGFDDFCAKWKNDKDHQLLRLVLDKPVTQSDIENMEQILMRATTAFRCSSCVHWSHTTQNSFISYPSILVHKHSQLPHAFEMMYDFPITCPLHLKFLLV
ncbi:hypothetical protein BDQ17DRAFT_910926 [Cyathus striatus]|nr:hypothetical protein BDQ17DRAFT_910926 [Cyathus striatus]